MAVYNHLLFSEIFFSQVRSETTDLDNLRAVLSTIRDTWQYYLPPPPEWDGPAWVPVNLFPPDDVAQLRAKVVEQIFAYLELTYDPCEADERAFFLYADRSREDKTGLCLVLPYSDNIEGRDPETGIIPKGRNYAQQLIRLLREHELDWGVLTNGRHWRLFHRTELSPTETYLHVDLERIIADDDIENYIVFHRFFSRSAFARQDSRQRLDLYEQQSDEATKVIEDHLSAQVEEIARQLCQGLVESCRAAGEDVTTSETRAAIYKNALFLVYRLLFVLYAEARDLLPLDVPAYRAVCLQDLLAEVRDNHKHGMRYKDDHTMWDCLQALFALIDQGDPAAGVSAYNGGLFDPGRRLFLTEHSIRNDYLQAALIRLSTFPAKGKTYDQDREPRPIDYRDLSVRHFGSLYEGLLEYNLFVVEDEPHVVRVNKKKTKYVPYSQAGKVRASETLLQVGDVYFSETAGERKATGSYYTPEDVVDYIVRNTVGWKLAELRVEFYETREIERQLTDLADTPPDIALHGQIQQSLDDQFLRFVRAEVLDLRILDPAMGSGHFLVNAIHAMANFIVEMLNETPWENHEIDTDVATWKREVAERCIFGVDLNELAVELAKLCLWMTTTAKGKPLTFLDHHLRCGDSLVGAWLEEAGIYPLAKKESEQAFTLPLSSFQLQLDEVLAGYQELYSRSSDDVEEVREKARLFDAEIYPALRPYRELLDLHTGIYFGAGPDDTTYAELRRGVHDADTWARLRAESAGHLLPQCSDRHWFHWELEFPEVFGVRDRGFDAVLGNPPYVNVQADAFFKTRYKTANSRNLYAYMLETSVDGVRPGGFFGLVVPLSVSCSDRMIPVQDFLADSTRTTYFTHFAKRPSKLFPDVELRICIVFGQRRRACSETARLYSSAYLRWRSQDRSTLFSNISYSDVTDFRRVGAIPKVGSEMGRRVLEKLFTQRRVIGDWRRANANTASVYYHGVAGYWTKAYTFVPYYQKGDDPPARSSKTHELEVRDAETADILVAIINSNLFYWYWISFSDCFDVTKALIDAFPLDLHGLSRSQRTRLQAIVRQLMREYQCTSARVSIHYPTGEVTIQQIHPRLSQDTIDQIDPVLGEIYGFSQEELDFIRDFDREYRFEGSQEE